MNYKNKLPQFPSKEIKRNTTEMTELLFFKATLEGT